MKRFITAALAAVTLAIVAVPAIDLVIIHAVAVAADAAPETVAQATGETTKITWAWGALVSQWAGALGSLVLAVAAWALRLLPAQIYAILVTARADQLIAKAIDYGVNAVKDASKDKTLEVNVGNQVLAKALQYVLDNAPGWLTTWLGGPEAIAAKIWARLKLDPAASDTDVAAIADRVASAQ